MMTVPTAIAIRQSYRHAATNSAGKKMLPVFRKFSPVRRAPRTSPTCATCWPPTGRHCRRRRKTRPAPNSRWPKAGSRPRSIVWENLSNTPSGPCIRDRVAQTSALLVLAPIFEADLQPEQYAYRPGRSANDAVKRAHGLLNRGVDEVVDGDLSNYFGEIPHAGFVKRIARRVSDGRMLRLIKAWLEMPVEEDDGKGGKRRTNRARRERKGTPQGSPIAPLLSERSHNRGYGNLMIMGT